MKRYGELVVDEGYATEEQVLKALEYQRTSEKLLGKVMIDMGIITLEQQYEALTFGKSPEGGGKRFGQICEEFGYASAVDIERALAFQKKIKGYLGEIMMELGYLTLEQHNYIVKLQQEYGV